MSETSLPIPERDVVALGDIATNIAGLRLLFVNVFGIGNPGGTWTLVDAGIPFSASRIKKWAEETWGDPPSTILLTHGHFDHVSGAQELSEAWDVPNLRPSTRDALPHR